MKGTNLQAAGWLRGLDSSTCKIKSLHPTEEPQRNCSPLERQEHSASLLRGLFHKHRVSSCRRTALASNSQVQEGRKAAFFPEPQSHRQRTGTNIYSKHFPVLLKVLMLLGKKRNQTLQSPTWIGAGSHLPVTTSAMASNRNVARQRALSYVSCAIVRAESRSHSLAF